MNVASTCIASAIKLTSQALSLIDVPTTRAPLTWETVQPRFRRTFSSVAPAGIFVPADSKIKKPEDLAGAVLFLSSPASDFCTGQTIFVDGGYTAK